LVSTCKARPPGNTRCCKLFCLCLPARPRWPQQSAQFSQLNLEHSFVFFFSFFLSVCLSAFLSICSSVCLSVCLSVYLLICLSVCLPFCLSVCLPFCLSAHLSVCLSVFVCVFV